MRLQIEKTKKIEVPNDPDSGYINIRALSQEEIDKIQSKSINVAMSDGNASVSVDSYIRENSVAMACLKGWGNFFLANGEELKFGNSSIEKVSHMSINVDGEDIRFLKWVCQCHDDFQKEIKGEMEEARGN